MSANIESINVLVELAAKFSGGVIIFDNISKGIAFINSEARQMTGLSQESTSDDIRELMKAMPIADQRYLEWRLIKMKDEGPSDQGEVRICRPNVKPLEISVSGYNLLNQTVTMVFVQDNTKNKEHENYLIEFGTKKNTTLEGIAHFMSGAVTLMRNLSDGAGRSMRANNLEGIKPYLDMIDRNASHCLEVIKNLLQEEHGKSTSVRVKTSRANIVEKVGYIVENLKMAFPDRIFVLKCNSEIVLAPIDEIKFLQIVNNLASNAIKFSPPDKPITFGISEIGERIVTFVSDLGIGIPLELQPRIFDRNSSAGRDGLNGEESFGKGLSICKSLAKLLHGELWFESVPDVGSIFFIAVPKEPNLAQPVEPHDWPSISTRHKEQLR